MLLPVLVFLAVTLSIGGVYFWLMPTRTEQRLQVLNGEQKNSEWHQTMVKLAGPLANLSSPQIDWDSSALRVRFFNAGIRNERARLVYYATKTLLPVALVLPSFVLFSVWLNAQGTTLLFYVSIVALIGCYVPNLVLWWLVRVRQREIFETFPDAVDLMLVCVEAGLGLDAGLARVANEIKIKSIALAEELHLTNLEVRAGGTREKALKNLARRTGVEELETFAVMLTQADKFGTSVGDSLRVFSDELRHKRQTRAEQRAAKVPTLLLIPMVLFIFPSIIMVMMGPAVIQIVRAVMPMLTGF
jgi:tight adherence protein C